MAGGRAGAGFSLTQERVVGFKYGAKNLNKPNQRYSRSDISSNQLIGVLNSAKM